MVIVLGPNMFAVTSVLEASVRLPQNEQMFHAVMPASQKSAAIALGGPHIHMCPIWPASCKQMHSAVFLVRAVTLP